MARIRSIKPDFFRSAKIGRLSPQARLLFIGCWTEADDTGRLLGTAKHLNGVLFSFDDATDKRVESWLQELIAARLLVPYIVDDIRYLVIPGWEEHQRISHPAPSKYPSPSGAAPESLRSPSGNPPGGREGKGEERKGREKTIAPVGAKVNPIWDALAEEFGEPQTRTEKSMRGKTVRDLKEAGATPEAIHERCAEHRRRWSNVDCTETSLTKHWTHLARAGPSPGPPEPKGYASLRAVDDAIEGRDRDLRGVEADSSGATRRLPAPSDTA